MRSRFQRSEHLLAVLSCLLLASDCSDSEPTTTAAVEKVDTCPASFDIYNVLYNLSAGVSVLALLVLLVVYGVFPRFHNFPGFMVISLALCLMMATLMRALVPFFDPAYMVASKSTCAPDNVSLVNATTATPMQPPVSCRIAGILLYSFYLATFTWMTLFGVDLWMTFHRAGAPSFSSRGGERRRILNFSLFGYVVPLVITVLSIIVDVVGRGRPESAMSWILQVATPQYGVRRCYFSNPIASRIWFTVPVGVMILMNFMICGLVIFAILRAVRDSSLVNQRSLKEMLLLCFKLTSIFGVGWLIELVMALGRPSSTLRHIVAIVNALQGFLLAMCFLLSKQVRQQAKESFGKRTSHGGPTTSMTEQ